MTFWINPIWRKLLAPVINSYAITVYTDKDVYVLVNVRYRVEYPSRDIRVNDFPMRPPVKIKMLTINY